MAMQISRKICRNCFAGPFSAAFGVSLTREGTPQASQAARQYSRYLGARRPIRAFKFIMTGVVILVTGNIFYREAASDKKYEDYKRIRQKADELELLFKSESGKNELLELEVEALSLARGRRVSELKAERIEES